MPLEIKSEPQQDEPQKTTQLEPSIKNNPETISITQKSQVKSFKCNRCQKIFSIYSDLKEHVKSCLGRKEYNFSCQKCRKQFAELWELENHMKSPECVGVNPETLKSSDQFQPFKCNICKSIFSTYSGLKQHAKDINTWKCVEVFECSLCQKTFKNYKDLNTHIVIVHPVCKKPQTFRNSQKNSNYNLSCRFCKSLFENVINFNYHQCKNQTLKPKPIMLKCQLCDYRFKKAEYLKTHIENVHQTKAQKLENYNSLSSILSCRFCKKTFKYVPTFTYHLSTAHGGENQQNLKKKNKVHKDRNKVHEEKKPDLLKLAVDMSGIEKQSKEPFINLFFN